ncbi:Hat transposon superfamily protein [Thalictrum thalictroides]|uniref:Hat transposon superfamily protein n=1 Tax=Thalictrum thalictroides TaxID=46969 RepID=A0A7J6VQD8_THATH|nr:Hat transposon superfamily protein [Thalictrum thalictroides]
MVDAIIARGGSSGFEIPSCDELSSLIQDEMKDIHHYVKEVRQSWQSTGCTILLDRWTDEKGCSLVNFLVDCPKGPIFLKSADITGTIGNVNAMISLIDEVIEDVGVENVVQVITYTSSEFMDKVGKQLMNKYRTIFWSVCASHCITLMLQKIGMMKTMRRVWSQANTITKFIYSDETLLRLVKEHTHGRDLIMSSRIKSTIPFLTLENIVSENENLMIFFDSSTWKTSNWAHTAMGRELSNVVEDPTFWTEATLVLKATIPLVRSLLLVNGGHDNPLVPIIYETMDQVKETIKKEFRNKNYMPFWDAIDEIWDNTLHSHLHSAGYFLNPSLHYSSDFSSDSEVATGLSCCIVHMGEDHKTQDCISLQLDKYRTAMGTFGEEIAVDDRTKLPPVTWWSLYGSQCPELQKFAIRILSQTCCGASRYNLRRSSSEQRQTQGMKCGGIEFVQHNAHLQHSLSVKNNTTTNSNFFLEHTKELNDFVMAAKQELNSGRDGSDLVTEGKQELNTERDDSGWSDTDEAIVIRGVISSFEM